ncbi:MAG TPA: hypothetical protein VGH23_15295 [Rhizomicrobium sp.]|jgi:hypothetical protein
MKQKEIDRLLRANPAAARDSSKIMEARKAIKERRKAGYAGKGYDLAPSYGSKSGGLPINNKSLHGGKSKLHLLLD